MSDWAFLARALTDLHQYRDARSALRHLDRTGRRHPSVVYLTHGHYHNVRGELRLAESWYRKAAAKEPAALVFLGAVQAQRGRFADAKKSHRMATRSPDSDWLAKDEAFFNLGLILRAERRYHDALRCFDRAIELDPKYSLAFDAKADALAALSVEVPHAHSVHWQQMVDTLYRSPATCHELTRAYTKRYSRRSAGWMLFAQLLAGFARYQEAASMLRKAVRLTRSEEWKESPEDRLAVRWGLFYVEKKDYKRAEAAFRSAIAVRASPANQIHLADVLIIQGRFAEARPVLRRVVRTQSDQVGFAHYQLGLIARARRQYSNALQYFDAALRYDRSFPLARQAGRDVCEAMRLTSRSL